MWRWGPNHNVLLVISRWKKSKKKSVESDISDTDDSNYIIIEGKRVLEVIAIKNELGELTLPGVIILYCLLICGLIGLAISQGNKIPG